jgi:hypothetical protein
MSGAIHAFGTALPFRQSKTLQADQRGKWGDLFARTKCSVIYVRPHAQLQIFRRDSLLRGLRGEDMEMPLRDIEISVGGLHKAMSGGFHIGIKRT